MKLFETDILSFYIAIREDSIVSLKCVFPELSLSEKEKISNLVNLMHSKNKNLTSMVCVWFLSYKKTCSGYNLFDRKT